ncbi:zinc-dependent alcohol dehydrogenase family protein [Anditalea andensis]|uniref:Enoyl reductase (ER) domain-containing protein n=1 Tax=Anditalea andensis TaxID=1048983 RepID=A0A074KWT5_9BACT|nr:NAD(P)-dependent alcohol dehydrogenase [Anditalea andensis]KEO72655.1 hypothetical protein EL17_18115 [Anditalea andensis]
MKSIILQSGYGLDKVILKEQAMPDVREDEVLIRVQCISLNQLDLMIVRGAFGTDLPHVLGSDAVGIVERTGREVTTLKVGDVVTTHFIQNWEAGSLEAGYLKKRLGTTVSGVFSEYVALPMGSVVKIPQNLNMEEASTLPMAGLTAWEAIVNAGQLKSGQTVLLQGTGGVSIFALQFAKALGARVILTSSDDEKLGKAKMLGADEIINYSKTPDWQNKVLEITEGNGVDLALEMSWKDVGKTMEGMKLGGKIVVVGLMGGANTDLSVFGIMQKSLSVLGIQVGSKSSFEAMNKAIEHFDIRPIIDRSFNINQFLDAFNYFDRGKHFGKVVITF